MDYKEATPYRDAVFNWLCAEYPADFTYGEGKSPMKKSVSWFAYGDWWYNLIRLTEVSEFITEKSPVYNDFLILFKSAKWPEKKWLDLL